MIVDNKQVNLILDIEDNKVFCANGDFAIGYKIDYPAIYSRSEKDFENIYSDWVKSFKLLPIGSIVVKSDVFLKQNFSTEHFPKDTFLQRSEAKHFSKREYLKHDGFIFFIWSKKETLKNRDIKNPFVFPRSSNFDKENIELRTFEESVKNVSEYNSQNQIKLTALTESEILNFEQFYFNGFQNLYTGDLYAEKEQFTFDDSTNIGILSIEDEDKLPCSVFTSIKDDDFSSDDGDFVFHQGYFDNLGLKFKYNHILNQVIYIDDTKQHVNQLHKNLNALKATRKFNPFNESGARVLEKVLNDVIDDKDQFLRGHTNIIYWSDDKSEFNYIKQQLIRIFNKLSITPNSPSKEQLKNIFFNTYYANASYLSTNNCYITDIQVISALLLSISNYKSDKEGIYLTERVFNTPVIFDFWDDERLNIQSRNFGIFAPTGQGKSVTIQKILRPLIENDVVSIIIDLGGSYTKFANLFPKEDVEIFSYEEGKALGLNPFILTESQTTPSPDKIEELSAFIWTLVKQSDEPNDLEQTSMRKLISFYYDMEESDYSWESFYYFIDRNKETLYEQLDIDDKSFFQLSEFLHAGSNFVGDGMYANILQKSDTSQNFVGKKLIIFELDSVKENKLVLTVILQVISEAIQKIIWSDRTTKGIVLFDEFAKQLEFPNVFRSVKHYMEAIRKFYGSVGIVLQTVNQLPNDKDGNTIIDNMQTKIFLPAENYTDQVQRLRLNSHTKNQLSSLRNKHTGEGYTYSEVYIDRKNYNNVYRIELSKEELIAYETEGRPYTEVLRLFNESGNMEQAILKYMNK